MTLSQAQIIKELNQVQEELQTYQKGDILKLYIKRKLRTKADLYEALMIMGIPFVHQHVSNPSQQRKATKINNKYQQFTDQLPPGAPRRASKALLIKKNPHLAGHITATENVGREKFTRYDIECPWNELSVENLRHIANCYRKVAQQNQAYAKAYDEVADGLEQRKVRTFGELFEQSPDTYIRYMNKLKNLT